MLALAESASKAISAPALSNNPKVHSKVPDAAGAGAKLRADHQPHTPTPTPGRVILDSASGAGAPRIFRHFANPPVSVSTSPHASVFAAAPNQPSRAQNAAAAVAENGKTQTSTPNSTRLAPEGPSASPRAPLPSSEAAHSEAGATVPRAKSAETSAQEVPRSSESGISGDANATNTGANFGAGAPVTRVCNERVTNEKRVGAAVPGGHNDQQLDSVLAFLEPLLNAAPHTAIYLGIGICWCRNKYKKSFLRHSFHMYFYNDFSYHPEYPDSLSTTTYHTSNKCFVFLLEMREQLSERLEHCSLVCTSRAVATTKRTRARRRRWTVAAAGGGGRRRGARGV